MKHRIARTAGTSVLRGEEQSDELDSRKQRQSRAAGPFPLAVRRYSVWEGRRCPQRQRGRLKRGRPNGQFTATTQPPRPFDPSGSRRLRRAATPGSGTARCNRARCASRREPERTGEGVYAGLIKIRFKSAQFFAEGSSCASLVLAMSCAHGARGVGMWTSASKASRAA